MPSSFLQRSAETADASRVLPTITLLAGLIAVVLTAQAQAADAVDADMQPNELPTIEVRGERDRAAHDIERARVALDARAGGTTLVRAEDYDAGRAATVSDIMAFAPGVVAQTRHGEDTRFSIRGSGIQRGFLMRGIQLYQDGIPLNLADGAGDVQSIDPLALQHVEIWRGANALEYGSSTLGGAVNFVTPTGRSALAAKLRLDAGAHGQRRVHAAIAGADAVADGVLSVTHGEQDGWREHSATRSTRLSANVGLRFDDTLEGRVYLQHVDAEMEMPGSISRAAMAVDRRQAAPNSARLDAGNNYRLDRIATRLAWTPSSEQSVTASAWLADRDRFHPMVHGILQQASRDTGVDVRSVLDFSTNAGPTRRLAFGASSARYRGDEARFTNPDGRPGTSTGRQSLDGRVHALYAEYSHGITDTLTLQAGAQATRATRRLDNRTMPSGSYDVDFTGISPKLGLLFDTDAHGQFFANVSRSFEPAPFGEATVRPALPLPNAQKAMTFEAGWRRRAGAVDLEATAYHARIDGELLALTDATGASIGTANADRTIHRGVELGASLPLGDALQLRGTYLWNDFVFDDDIAYGDNRIAGIAPHLLHAELEWRVAPWLAIAPMVEWQPPGTWIDHANTVCQDGHTLLHLRVHGVLTSKLRWFADMRNLTDRAYVASTAVQANVRGVDGAYYFPGDPRSIYLGLEWRM